MFKWTEERVKLWDHLSPPFRYWMWGSQNSKSWIPDDEEPVKVIMIHIIGYFLTFTWSRMLPPRLCCTIFFSIFYYEQSWNNFTMTIHRTPARFYHWYFIFILPLAYIYPPNHPSNHPSSILNMMYFKVSFSHESINTSACI